MKGLHIIKWEDLQIVIAMCIKKKSLLFCEKVAIDVQLLMSAAVLYI